MKLVNIGFGSMVAAGRVLAIVAPDSAPIKRLPIADSFPNRRRAILSGIIAVSG